MSSIASSIYTPSELNTDVEFRDIIHESNLLSQLSKCGISSLSEIQNKTLLIMTTKPYRDILAQSPSGTGKSTCLIIGTILRVDRDLDMTQAVIVLPTYELALQFSKNFLTLSEGLEGFRCCMAMKGQDFNDIGNLRPHVVVATPGTLINWIDKYNVLDISQIKMFILDEADKMIDSAEGFYKEITQIMQHVTSTPQKLLYSATFTPTVLEMAQKFVPDAEEFRVEEHNLCLKNIKQMYWKCSNIIQDKVDIMYSIYTNFNVGDMDIIERESNMASFRKGEKKLMLTTNVSSRGIDVPSCKCVINFTMPRDKNRIASPEDYLHRIGRTGRFGKPGIAINLIDNEGDMDAMHMFEKHYGMTICNMGPEKIQVKNENADDFIWE